MTRTARETGPPGMRSIERSVSMTKSGRSLRLGRLFKTDETPLFLVPLDHTVTDGPFTDARGYDALLGILADNGPRRSR
jgi:DhnA family fructose-bisphosphate aldolase class Ia